MEFLDGALCELFRSRDIYDVEKPVAVTPYDAAELKASRNADELTSRTADAISELETPTSPRWEAKLGFSRRAKPDVTYCVGKMGLVTWRCSVKRRV